MKYLLPTLSFFLSTTLCTLGCYFSGMPAHDLLIAACASGAVSATVAFGAFAFVNARSGSRQPA
jgi:hypothetical protein